MSRTERLRKWVVTPPLAGGWALVGAGIAVALPTLIRLSVDGVVSGVGFSPYFSFVLMSAVLIGWRHAAVVALVSAVVADLLFEGSHYQLLEGPSTIFGVIVFLGSSTFIIGVVHALRSLAEECPQPDTTGSTEGIIFSSERGQAWASWPGATSVPMGPQDEVAEMMKDFLAQLELGKRLTGQAPTA